MSFERSLLLDECLIPIETTYKERLNTLKKHLENEYQNLYETTYQKIEAIENDSLALQIEAAAPTIAPGNFDEQKSTPALPGNFIEVLLRNEKTYLKTTLDLSNIQLNPADISAITNFLAQEHCTQNTYLRFFRDRQTDSQDLKKR